MIFKNIPYKQKVFGLIIIFVMMFIAAYKRVFNPTLALIKSNKQMNETIEKAGQAAGEIRFLQKEVDYLDRIMGDKQRPPEEIQQALLEFVSRYRSVRLYELKDIHESEENGFKVYSNQLTLQGSYNDLASCIYSLEKEFNLARIVNIHFYRKKEHQRRSEKLLASIIFQNYLPNPK